MIMKSTMCVNWTAASVSSSGKLAPLDGARREGVGHGRGGSVGRRRSTGGQRCFRRRGGGVGSASAGRHIARANMRAGARWRRDAERRYHRTVPLSALAMLVNCVAYQNGTQARRHPGRGHQRVREPAGLLRLGRAVRAVARRARPDGGGVRAAPARRRGRAQGPPAARRSRSTSDSLFAVAAHGRAGARRRRRAAARRRGRDLRRPQLHALGAACARRRVSATCAREPSASRSC